MCLLMNQKAVCRTAPDTPGLCNISDIPPGPTVFLLALTEKSRASHFISPDREKNIKLMQTDIKPDMKLKKEQIRTDRPLKSQTLSCS